MNYFAINFIFTGRIIQSTDSGFDSAIYSVTSMVIDSGRQLIYYIIM